MISTILCALALGPAPVFTPERRGWFWLDSSVEAKAAQYITANNAQTKHTLTLKFNVTSLKYTTGTNTERSWAVKKPHAFAVGDGSNVTDGYFTNETPPTGTSSDWMHGTTGVLQSVNGQYYVSLAYHDLSSGVLIGGTTFEAVYREKATVGSDVKVYHYHVRLNVSKQLADGDGPVDSRLMYGNPNDTWSTLSANGTLRNLNFNPWIFHGGLFVGNMPLDTGDRSGFARTQLWFPAISGGPNYLQYAHVALAHLGFWPVPSGSGNPNTLQPWRAIDVALWSAPSTETETESTATWSNRWGPTTTANTGYLSTLGFSAWTSSSSRDYANWSIMTAVSSSAATYDSDALRKVLLALKDETQTQTNGEAGWRYFAGKEMGTSSTYPGGDNTNLPTADLKPRLWVLCLEETAESEEVL